MVHECLIALGSNLGRREETLEEALRRLEGTAGIEVVGRSRWIETQAAGGPDGQGAFLNGAAKIETSLAPEELLDALLDIENDLGRRREVQWGPRTVDLDLLLYGAAQISTARLEVPHPRMAFRRFVLQPAAEIAGEMVHPVCRWTVGRMLEHLNEAPPWVAILGRSGAEARRLAEPLAAEWGAPLVSADGPEVVGGIESLVREAPKILPPSDGPVVSAGGLDLLSGSLLDELGDGSKQCIWPLVAVAMIARDQRPDHTPGPVLCVGTGDTPEKFEAARQGALAAIVATGRFALPEDS